MFMKNIDLSIPAVLANAWMITPICTVNKYRPKLKEGLNEQQLGLLIYCTNCVFRTNEN